MYSILELKSRPLETNQRMVTNFICLPDGTFLYRVGSELCFYRSSRDLKHSIKMSGHQAIIRHMICVRLPPDVSMPGGDSKNRDENKEVDDKKTTNLKRTLPRGFSNPREDSWNPLSEPKEGTTDRYFVVTCSRDFTVRMWNPWTGKEIRTLRIPLPQGRKQLRKKDAVEFLLPLRKNGHFLGRTLSNRIFHWDSEGRFVKEYKHHAQLPIETINSNGWFEDPNEDGSVYVLCDTQQSCYKYYTQEEGKETKTNLAPWTPEYRFLFHEKSSLSSSSSSSEVESPNEKRNKDYLYFPPPWVLRFFKTVLQEHDAQERLKIIRSRLIDVKELKPNVYLLGYKDAFAFNSYRFFLFDGTKPTELSCYKELRLVDRRFDCVKVLRNGWLLGQDSYYGYINGFDLWDENGDWLFTHREPNEWVRLEYIEETKSDDHTALLFKRTVFENEDTSNVRVSILKLKLYRAQNKKNLVQLCCDKIATFHYDNVHSLVMENLRIATSSTTTDDSKHDEKPFLVRCIKKGRKKQVVPVQKVALAKKNTLEASDVDKISNKVLKEFKKAYKKCLPKELYKQCTYSLASSLKNDINWTFRLLF